jgi:phosphocarrier protein
VQYSELFIINKLGLHARAAAKLSTLSRGFKSEIQLDHQGHRVNAKSIMGLMMLAAGKGTPLTLYTQGEDEIAAAKAIKQLFEQRFGENE